MIDITPGPIAFQLGPISLPWYGIGYALGLFLAAWVITREAKRRGFDPDIVPNGMIVVAVAAIIGGRAYHVIDQWQLYRDDLPRIVLPPYSGLGAFGGLLTGIIALFLFTRWKKLEFWSWMDIAAPGVFVMQAVARWGNFFNQELYGPPTNLPFGIAIQCANRVAAYACPPGSLPTDTLGEHFQPLFLYESISGLIGAVALLWLARRFGPRLRPGDIAAIFIIWYSTVRFGLEYLRSAYDWTFFGIPTAQMVSAGFVLFAVVVLVYRHRHGATHGESTPAEAGPPAEGHVPAEDHEPAEDAQSGAEDGATRPGLTSPLT